MEPIIWGIIFLSIGAMIGFFIGSAVVVYQLTDNPERFKKMYKDVTGNDFK